MSLARSSAHEPYHNRRFPRLPLCLLQVRLSSNQTILILTFHQDQALESHPEAQKEATDGIPSRPILSTPLRQLRKSLLVSA